jgi:apolipoprotein N-acyltransferase
MRRIAARGLAAGLLVTLGLPPFGWWPLALAGVAVLVGGQDRVAGRRARLTLGVAFGFGFLGPGLWWMTEFSLPGWLLATLLETAIVAVAVAVVPARSWLLPATLLLADAFRGIWPFGGVPIATTFDTQIGGPLLQTARLGGGLLVTVLVVLTGIALARRRLGPLLLVVLVTIAAYHAPDGRAVDPLRAAVVQGGGARGTRAIDTSEAAVFRAHVAATERVPDGVDLILWPEDVVDVEVDADHRNVNATAEGARLATIADEHGATVVAGVIEGEDDQPFRNVAQAWLPDGRPGPRYEKHQRVPFGEWIPFRSLVERVADVSAVPRDARVGRGPSTLRTPAGRLGLTISFEVFFARRARAAVREGGEVLLVPTNASSYSSTQMPALELGAARLRAIETGRDLLQAAPTGFSATVNHRGNVERHTDLGERAVLDVTVARRRGTTLYTRLGDVPLVGSAVLWVGGWVGWSALRRRRRRRRAPRRPSALRIAST